MSERLAIGLVIAGGLFLVTVGMLGLAALGADEATLFLAFFVPLILSSYGVSLVLTHYADRRRHDR